MKVSTVALSFLILAAALGSQAWVLHDLEKRELPKEELRPPRANQGVRRPIDCCYSYVPQRIRCTLMHDYFETSNACPQPAVIFITKKRQRICANPSEGTVLKCMIYLSLNAPPH